jgi:hypothetical protein
MKKKYYTAPAVWQTEINIQTSLLRASITGTQMEGFTEKLEIGDETDKADARHSYIIWDEED